MYGGKPPSSNNKLLSLRNFEKLSYAILVPSLFAFLGYKMYQQNVTDRDENALKLKEVEDKYIKLAKENVAQKYIVDQSDKMKEMGMLPLSYIQDTNMIKLQDFKRKVFVIGVYDDPLS